MFISLGLCKGKTKETVVRWTHESVSLFILIKWSVLDFVGENRNVCTAAVQK